MAWLHFGSRKYYYRSVRVNGRAVRRYIGPRAIGEVAEAVDAYRRLERVIETREREAEQARLRQAEAPLLVLCESTGVLTRAALVAAGYYQHDRGAWRHSREQISRKRS